MNKSFMYDLYFGRLVPWERRRAKDPAYTPITRKISDIKLHFERLLSPEEYKKFEEMGNLQAEADTIEDIILKTTNSLRKISVFLDVSCYRQ